jgi:hypothetical protein
MVASLGASGASLFADDARAEEFFDRARAALEDLLEVDDYAVAEALFALGYYLYGRVHRARCPPPALTNALLTTAASSPVQGDLARFSYYITLARNICQRIG